MRNAYVKTILLFLFFNATAFARQENFFVATKDTTSVPFESPYCLSGGVYLGNYFSLQYGVESDFNRKITIGARFSKIRLTDFNGIPCNNSQFLKYCPDGNITEFTVYAGKTFYFKKYFSFCAVTGPALVKYYRPVSYTTTYNTNPYPYTEYHYKYGTNSVIGWTGKAEVRAMPFKFAAIGFGLFYNYNKQIRFGGAMISLMIGKFR